MATCFTFSIYRLVGNLRAEIGVHHSKYRLICLAHVFFFFFLALFVTSLFILTFVLNCVLSCILYINELLKMPHPPQSPMRSLGPF